MPERDDTAHTWAQEVECANMVRSGVVAIERPASVRAAFVMTLAISVTCGCSRFDCAIDHPNLTDPRVCVTERRASANARVGSAAAPAKLVRGWRGYPSHQVVASIPTAMISHTHARTPPAVDCPTGQHGLSCSGNGQCVPIVEATSAYVRAVYGCAFYLYPPD